MRKFSKLIAGMLVISSVVSIISGCSNGSTATDSGAASSVVVSSESTQPELKHEDLVVYLMGDAPNDTQMVVDELNKKTEADINASLKIVNIPWADWGTKYKLVLASGEKVDLIYTAFWCQFAEQVQKGAFLPIDELIATNAPESAKQIPQGAWDAAKFNGKIYAVPTSEKTYDSFGFAIRGDLRKKYGVPEVNSIATFEQYLDAIKKNEPDMLPLNAMGAAYSETFLMFQSMNGLMSLTMDNQIADIKHDQKNISQLINYSETKEFEDYAKLMKTWADKGFWSKSVLSSKISSDMQFAEGKSGAAIYHAMPVGALYTKLKDKVPGVELEFFPFTDFDKVSFATNAMQNATAIPTTASDPARSLMLIDKLSFDKEYYNLIQYGIKGKNYDITAEGKLTLPAGLLAKDNGFGVDALGAWAFRNTSLKIEDTTQWPGHKALQEYLASNVVPNKLDAFNFNKSAVAAESAAMEQVVNTYLPAINYGIVDPGKSVTTFRQKLKEAGADKVMAEMQIQIDAYAKERGY